MKRLIFISAVVLVAAVFGVISLPSHASDKQKTVTFNKDVAPILFKNCAECHRPGEIAPMSLLSYKDARPWARSIKEKVMTGTMPPWHADPKYGEFTNDRRLSPGDVATIASWVDQGAPEGNAKDLQAAPKFLDGWNIGKPDIVFYMPEAYSVPADGVVDYKYFTVPTNFTEDRWIQAAEIRPGTRGVVHHIIVFTKNGSDQKLLTGYAPGEQPVVISDGLAKKVPAGSSLVFQVHYTPNGTAATDRSYVGLIFSKTKPRNEVLTRPVMNTRFVIPPGDPNHKVDSSYTFAEDSHIHSLMPHMHFRGKDFEYRVTFPDGTSKVILSVPKYDFAWQSYYILKEPIAAPKGTRLDCLAHFDNSEKNRYNPDPSKEVRWGDQTFEEMMIGWTSYTVDKNEQKPAMAAAGQK